MDTAAPDQQPGSSKFIEQQGGHYTLGGSQSHTYSQDFCVLGNTSQTIPVGTTQYIQNIGFQLKDIQDRIRPAALFQTYKLDSIETIFTFTAESVGSSGTRDTLNGFTAFAVPYSRYSVGLDIDPLVLPACAIKVAGVTTSESQAGGTEIPVAIATGQAFLKVHNGNPMYAIATYNPNTGGGEGWTYANGKLQLSQNQVPDTT